MPEQTSSDYISVPPDALPKVKHPWRRYFARNLDIVIYDLIWSAFSLLALRWNTGSFSFLILLEVYISFGLMLIIEPILLSTLGTTPGKWIFGLRVRADDGSKLSYSAALRRTWGVFHYGYGFAIPIYSLYRNYQSYKICTDDSALQWDEDNAYTILDLKRRRIAAFIAAHLLLQFIAALLVLQADMPRHRGALTAKEFTQNMNDLMDYNKLDYGSHLDEKGHWTEDPSDGTVTIHIFTLLLPDFQITETNGEVTKISFEVIADENNMIINNFTNIMVLAVKSYVCAQKEENFFSQLSVIPRENTAFTNFEYTRAGITVKNSMSYEGYRLFGRDFLSPIKGEKQSFHLEFSMEKTA